MVLGDTGTALNETNWFSMEGHTDVHTWTQRSYQKLT